MLRTAAWALGNGIQTFDKDLHQPKAALFCQSSEKIAEICIVTTCIGYSNTAQQHINHR